MTNFILLVKELLNKIYLLYQRFEKNNSNKSCGTEIFFSFFQRQNFQYLSKDIYVFYNLLHYLYLISYFDHFLFYNISKSTNNNKLFYVHEVHLIIIYLKLDLATEKSNKLTENNTNFTKTKILHPNFISYTNRLYFIARLIKNEKKNIF